MSKADAEQLRQAWDYIERNGFRTGSTGYIEPGDECAACALGADARGIAWAIFRYNDNSVKTLARARPWFARAIELAEAHA